MRQMMKFAGVFMATATVQTIKVEQQTTIQPGAVGTYPGYWYPQAYPGWNLPGYYGSRPGGAVPRQQSE